MHSTNQKWKTLHINVQSHSHFVQIKFDLMNENHFQELWMTFNVFQSTVLSQTLETSFRWLKCLKWLRQVVLFLMSGAICSHYFVEVDKMWRKTKSSNFWPSIGKLIGKPREKSREIDLLYRYNLCLIFEFHENIIDWKFRNVINRQI